MSQRSDVNFGLGPQYEGAYHVPHRVISMTICCAPKCFVMSHDEDGKAAEGGPQFEISKDVVAVSIEEGTLWRWEIGCQRAT